MSWTFILICIGAWSVANNYISKRTVTVGTTKDYVLMDCLVIILTVLPIVLTTILMAKGVIK